MRSICLLWRKGGCDVDKYERKGCVQRAKRERAWVDFHARSRFARSTIPEEKWGTTRSLAFKSPSHEKSIFLKIRSFFSLQIFSGPQLIN